MIEHLRDYWWAYWGIGASAALLWLRFKHTNRTRTRASRFRSVLGGSRHHDPDRLTYDPGLFARQLRLLLIGLPLIGLAVICVWWLGN
jgi:hypothetical protein